MRRYLQYYKQHIAQLQQNVDVLNATSPDIDLQPTDDSHSLSTDGRYELRTKSVGEVRGPIALLLKGAAF
jgi:hypothetical protein